MSGERGFLIHLARAICDADRSLEDMKHGHRCRGSGCFSGHYTLCMAWRQAKAAAEYFRQSAARTGDPAADDPVHRQQRHERAGDRAVRCR